PAFRPVTRMSTNLQAELLLDARAKLGEGAIWDNRNQTLCWVDIEQRRLHVFDPSTGAIRAHDLGQMVSTVVPRARGGYAVALQRGFYSFDPAIGKIEPLHEPEQRPTVRF